MNLPHRMARSLPPLLACVLALVVLLTLLAGVWPALEPLSNLRWWFACGLGIIAGWSFLRARSRWHQSVAAGLAALALAGGWPGLALYVPQPSVGGPRSTPLRIGSTNLLFGIAHPKPVGAWMGEQDLDIVGFVEVKDSQRSQLRWSMLLESWRGEYPHQFVEVHDYYGLAILSRVPLNERRVQRTWDSLGEERGRPIALHADVEWEGESLRLTLVHPPRPERSWRRKVREDFLESLVTQAPKHGSWVVFGDFNTSEGSPWFRRLLRRTGLVDSRRGRGRFATWSPAWFWLPLVPLDHILVRGPRVLSRGIGPSVRSDHRPIHATLAWPKTPTPPSIPR